MIDNNTAIDDIISDTEEPMPNREFGLSLKQARESTGMTASEVAEKLLISVDIIKAIDNSDAESLPAATFTQGYIRSYARILQINADEAIQAYNEVIPSGKQVLTPNSVLSSKKSASSGSHKSAMMLITTIMVVGLVFWAYDNFYKIPKFESDQFSLQSDLQDETDTSMGFQSDAVTDYNDDQTIDLVLPEESPDSEVMPDTAQASDETGMLENIQPEVEPEVVIGSGKDVVVIMATEDSWCEVIDANGKKLAFQVIRGDQKMTLKGNAPFKVVLGNASKVEIVINNEPVKFGHLVSASGKIANLSIAADATVQRYRKSQ